MRADANDSVEIYAETAEADGPIAEAHEPAAASAQATPPEADNPPHDGTLPASATRDEARLLVQSPTRLFFYWDLAHDPGPALRAALGDAAAKFRPAVRLVGAGGDVEGEPEATAENARSYWFDALPCRAYRAEFGFHAAGLPFVRVLSSNVVETPAAGVSADSDPAPEFEIGDREFARVLEVSGFKHVRRRATSDTLAAHTCEPGHAELPSSSPRAAPPIQSIDIF